MSLAAFFSRSLEKLKHPAGLHRFIQYVFFFFFIFVGVRFYFYVQWAMGKSEVFIPKPPSVEAFLPISALLGARRLLATGEYDVIHPAGLTILLMAFAVAFLFRKGFCGYLCPVGCASMMLDRMGRRLGISRRPPEWLSALMTVPKYLLLLFFIYLLFWNMDLRDVEEFIRTPYNMVADSKMLLFFLHPDNTLLLILGVLIMGGMLFPGFWCRGFCPYGALLGIFSMFSPFAARRDAEKCTGCGRCTRACPSRIAVHRKTRISGPECVGCAQCIDACPEKDCLTLRLGFTRTAPRLPFWAIAAGTLLVMYFFLAWASMSGNWVSTIPSEMVLRNHQNILRMQHP